MMFHYAVLSALGPREVLRVLGLNDDGSPARRPRSYEGARGARGAARAMLDASAFAHAR